MPFDRVGSTPLVRICDNYLSIVTGISGLFGGTGSAVLIGKGLAVTNAHVARASRRLNAFARSGRMLALEVMAVSDRLDLAVLGLDDVEGEPPPVAKASLAEPVWAMGTTAGQLAPVANGVVEQTCAWAQADGRLQPGLMFTAPAGPGYSGGPVVNRDGELVGIVEGVFTHFFDAVTQRRFRGQTVLFAYHAGDVLTEARRMLADAVPPAGSDGSRPPEPVRLRTMSAAFRGTRSRLACSSGPGWRCGEENVRSGR